LKTVEKKRGNLKSFLNIRKVGQRAQPRGGTEGGGGDVKFSCISFCIYRRGGKRGRGKIKPWQKLRKVCSEVYITHSWHQPKKEGKKKKRLRKEKKRGTTYSL